MSRQCLFEPLSHRNDAPQQACRPFDRGRDGLVVGEGAAVFTVEDLEHARNRGARVYAEVLGFGAAFDRRQDGSGLARAVQAALRDAGVGPEEIDHVNAHGLATRDSDVWEARGLAQVFGAGAARVLAVKSYIGNLGAGGGAAELAASLLALHHGVVPGTLNCEEPDPECPVEVLAVTPRPLTRPYILKLGFTQMGQCAALVFRRWQ
jgi:3-oxoacyl-[acyl-carrier-protein] synthase II